MRRPSVCPQTSAAAQDVSPLGARYQSPGCNPGDRCMPRCRPCRGRIELDTFQPFDSRSVPQFDKRMNGRFRPYRAGTSGAAYPGFHPGLCYVAPSGLRGVVGWLEGVKHVSVPSLVSPQGRRPKQYRTDRPAGKTPSGSHEHRAGFPSRSACASLSGDTVERCSGQES